MQKVIVNSQFLKHTCGSTDYLVEGNRVVCAYCFKPLGELVCKS